jgi:hypothetical protein
MEGKQNHNLPRSKRALHKQNNTDLLDNIINEYCLKRNSFHPKNPSPNIFIGKLELRMKKYYSKLYNSTIEYTK